MPDLPGLFDRAQIVAVFDGLGIDDEWVSSLAITPSEVEVGFYVEGPDGDPLEVGGEPAQVFYIVPIKEPEGGHA